MNRRAFFVALASAPAALLPPVTTIEKVPWFVVPHSVSSAELNQIVDALARVHRQFVVSRGDDDAVITTGVDVRPIRRSANGEWVAP